VIGDEMIDIDSYCVWGVPGDVVLKELLIKNSAMDDLGVPFKVVVGKVGM
jgi:hypothetical protein